MGRLLNGVGKTSTACATAVTFADTGKKVLLISTDPASNLQDVFGTKLTSKELINIGIRNQQLVINGVISYYDDDISETYYNKQQIALENMPESLRVMVTSEIPMRSYNIIGVENIRDMLYKDNFTMVKSKVEPLALYKLQDVIEDIYINNKKVIFTMGKGGVGKTSIAATIALGLSRKGVKVHLATTDPADHLRNVIEEQPFISMSHIDEEDELMKYREIVLQKAMENNLSKEDIDYIEEDLRSPCTQEIAVFRAFANIVAKSNEEVVIIDTLQQVIRYYFSIQPKVIIKK